jgi:sRNA-binding regulator protein Hfq
MAIRRGSMDEEQAKSNPISKSFEFIPKLKGKKIVIRLISGGQPITGVLESYNPYELMILTPKGETLVFKHAIATIETVNEPQGYRSDI